MDTFSINLDPSGTIFFIFRQKLNFSKQIFNLGVLFGDGLLSGGIFGQVVAKGLRSCCSALLVLLSFFRVVLLICTCCFLGSFVFYFHAFSWLASCIPSVFAMFLDVLAAFSQYIPW